MPQNRAPELNYYDELGVARDASTEQLREAFRGLVRLLHPDHQSDEHLKSVAERQMRNLNRMYEVLSDSVRRSEYDDLLQRRLDRHFGKIPPAAPQPEVPLAFPDSRTLSRYAWLGAATLSCLVLLWFVVDSAAGPGWTNGESRSPSSAGQLDAVSPPAPISGELARLRDELNRTRSERDAARTELSALRRAPSANSTSANSTAGPVAEPKSVDPQTPPAPLTIAEVPTSQIAPAIPLSTAAAPKPPAARAQLRRFGGFWFFVKNAEDKASPHLYPPEFIEATITEQNGQVRGHYRSRYRIVDKAISPDVNFDFKGTVNVAADTVTAGWIGPGGARGELTMKLVGEHSLKLDWLADRLGGIQGLTSGTASLTRRLD